MRPALTLVVFLCYYSGSLFQISSLKFNLFDEEFGYASNHIDGHFMLNLIFSELYLCDVYYCY